MHSQPSFDFVPNVEPLEKFEASPAAGIYKNSGIFLAVLFAIGMAYVYLSGMSERSILETPFLALAMFASIAGALYCAVKYGLLENKALQAFASANGWLPDTLKSPENLQGLMFGLGHSRRVDGAFTGEYCGLPMEWFDYSYTIGGGKSRTTYSTQVIGLGLSRSLPNLYIDGLKEKWGYLTESATTHAPKHIGSFQKTKLEGDFADHFDVYIPDSYEISALTILAPDAMQAMMHTPAHFDLEISGDNLYFYFPKNDTHPQTVRNMFASINMIMPEIYRTLERTNIYKSPTHRAAHASPEGAVRLQKRLHINWWRILGVATLLVTYFYVMSRIVFN